jgi:hypothetical protein
LSFREIIRILANLIAPQMALVSRLGLLTVPYRNTQSAKPASRTVPIRPSILRVRPAT